MSKKTETKKPDPTTERAEPKPTEGTEPKPVVITGASRKAAVRHDVLHGKPAPRYDVNMSTVQVRPGRVSLLGGAPGAGKTALAMQWVFEAIGRDSELRALVANAEMGPDDLIYRQIARLSRVNAAAIEDRRIAESDREAVTAALDRIEPLLDRIDFAASPTEMEAILKAIHVTGADIIILDYTQLINPRGGGNRSEREKINAVLKDARTIANTGRAVIVISSMARTKDKHGRSTYEGVSMASLNGSSGLEYSGDYVYLLSPAGPTHCVSSKARRMSLVDPKGRYGGDTEATLLFEKSYQSFRVLDDEENRHLKREEDACKKENAPIKPRPMGTDRSSAITGNQATGVKAETGDTVKRPTLKHDPGRW